MRIASFPHERLALGDTELVLLVDDHQPKISSLEFRLDERVGADGEVSDRRSPFSVRLTTDF